MSHESFYFLLNKVQFKFWYSYSNLGTSYFNGFPNNINCLFLYKCSCEITELQERFSSNVQQLSCCLTAAIPVEYKKIHPYIADCSVLFLFYYSQLSYKLQNFLSCIWSNKVLCVLQYYFISEKWTLVWPKYFSRETCKHIVSQAAKVVCPSVRLVSQTFLYSMYSVLVTLHRIVEYHWKSLHMPLTLRFGGQRSHCAGKAHHQDHMLLKVTGLDLFCRTYNQYNL